MGSLACAIASYLDARANQGRWLVRIEDLDPPREQAGADILILESLKTHGLHWDDTVRYQSTRLKAYEHALGDLESKGLVYRCQCTRKRVAALEGPYDRLCRTRLPIENEHCALRFDMSSCVEKGFIDDPLMVNDLFLGQSKHGLTAQTGDFIVRRKDTLFSYHLAVVTDDIDQGITHVVRGDDLLDSTPPQLALYAALGSQPPAFGHIPVVKDREGVKLSKQTGAKPLDNSKPIPNLVAALSHLNITDEKIRTTDDPEELLKLALKNFMSSTDTQTPKP